MKLTDLKIGNLTPYLSAVAKARHVRRGGFVAAAAALAAVFFVLGAFIRLLMGPVSLGPFSDRLSDALADAVPGLTVRYDQAALEWSREDGRVNLVVLGARVFDMDGRIIAQAPKAELAVAAGPLLSGDIELRRIALVGVQLTLVRTRNGELRLGVEKGHGDNDILKRITDAINADDGGQSSLQTFAVRNARIAFLDEGTGLFVVAPRANLAMTTAGANLKVSANADVEISGHPSRLLLDVNLPSAKQPVTGTISLSGLSLDALGTNAKAFQTLKGIKLITDLSAAFTLTSGNRLSYVDFGIGASGALAVRGFARGPMQVKYFRAVGKYDAQAGRFVIDDVQLSSDGAEAHGQGQVDIDRDPSGAASKVSVDFSVDKIAVNMPGVFLAPFKLSSADVRGAYLPAADRIDVEHLSIAGGSFALTASGKVQRSGSKSPAIEAQATVAPLGVRDLLRYWPKTVANGAWEWVSKNMKTGRVGPLVATTHIAVGDIDAPVMPEAAVNLTMPLSGVTMSYFHELTPMTNVGGTIKLTGDTFAADIISGRIGSLVLSAGHVVIPDLHADTNVADIAAHAQGKLPDILTLIDMKPLNYAKRFHLDPKTTLGAANLDISFKVPTKHDATDDDIKIGIKSAMKGMSVSLGEHTRVTEGDVDLTIDNDSLSMVGMVTLFGARLAINWKEAFKHAKNTLSSHIEVKGPLSDATRDALNFSSADFLKGVTPMTAVLTGQEGQIRHADMTLDITGAWLGVQSLGIGKPPGVAGTAIVSASFAPGTVIQSATMKITGPNLAGNGTLSFDKQGTFTQVSFPSVREGAANDFAFTLSRNAAGLRDIVLRGHSLDGTKIGRNAGSGQSGSATPPPKSDDDDSPFHISARLDRVALRNSVAVTDFTLDTTGFGDDRPQTLSFTGMLGKSPISGTVRPGDNGRKATIETQDAGLLLTGLFGFTSMKGGGLTVAATLPGRADTRRVATAAVPDFQGIVTITNFRVVDQPFLTRLFSAGSLTGITSLMGGKGIVFDKGTLPFASRNGVVSIKDARASGGAIGMTADGYLDRPKNQLALKGSLVPIFGVNSILGSIPLLGNLLVSKKGEGIFGMTYSATGNSDEPKISVNPLSMLTPGIFRRIFEGRIPEDAQLSQLPQTGVPPQTPSPPKTTN